MGATAATLTFSEAVESPSSPGQRSVLSSPVENVTAEDMLKGMESFVRAGKTANGKEAKFDLQDKGDHLVATSSFEIPAILGGGSATTCTTYKFEKEKLEMQSDFFQSEAHYQRGEPQCRSVVKVLSEPVRVEFWSDFFEVRSAGLILEKMLARLLGQMGTAAKARAQMDSPSEPGKHSVLSEPIQDADVTADTFLSWFRTFIVDSQGGAELPDGSIVEERGSLLDIMEVLGLSSRSFAKHCLDEAQRCVIIQEYGDDETMSSEVAITHLRVHKEPFRLEQYSVSRPGRRAGPVQARIIKTFVQGALEHMQEQD